MGLNDNITSTAIRITGNRLFSLGERAMITCSVPVLAVSMQWWNMTSNSSVVVEMLGVQELVLNIPIVTSTNNTNYTCKVNDGIFMESEEITIQVGGLCTINIWLIRN